RSSDGTTATRTIGQPPRVLNDHAGRSSGPWSVQPSVRASRAPVTTTVAMPQGGTGDAVAGGFATADGDAFVSGAPGGAGCMHAYIGRGSRASDAKTARALKSG